MTAPTASDQKKLNKLKDLQSELAKAFAHAKKFTGKTPKDTQVFDKIEDLLNQIAKLTEQPKQPKKTAYKPKKPAAKKK